MNPFLVGVILLGIWLLFPTRRRVPICRKRAAKWKIIVRMVIILFAVVAVGAAMLSIADVGLAFSFILGDVEAVFLGIGWRWGFTNISTFLFHPTCYTIWKTGGGDMWFDRLMPGWRCVACGCRK
jgi:hypothetical protein